MKSNDRARYAQGAKNAKKRKFKRKDASAYVPPARQDGARDKKRINHGKHRKHGKKKNMRMFLKNVLPLGFALILPYLKEGNIYKTNGKTC
jgi:hypothetical protein